MIAASIRLLLSKLSIVFCLGAIIAGATIDRAKPWPERYLSWMLMLAVGADGMRAGFLHVFFPDMALGIVAIISLWCSVQFKASIALYAILYYAGVSIGHFVQGFGHGNLAPDNFGVLLLLTVAWAFALVWLLVCCGQTVSGRPARMKNLAA